MNMEEKAIVEVIRLSNAMRYTDDRGMREAYDKLKVELDNKINAWIIVGLDVTCIRSQSYLKLYKRK